MGKTASIITIAVIKTAVIMIAVLACLMVAAPPCHAQEQSRAPQQKILDRLFLQYKAQPCAFSETVTTCEFDRPDHYGDYLAVAETTKQDMMVKTDQDRTDKQVGQTAGAGNSSSAVSSGSVPWLMGISLEHGATTQSVESNLITFRANVASIIKAAKEKDYVKSFRAGQNNALVRNLSKLSFAVSFTTSGPSGNAQLNSLAGYSLHFDVYNHRDPREGRYDSAWDNLLGDLTQVANATGRFSVIVRRNHASEARIWQARADNMLKALTPYVSDQQIQDVLRAVADDFVDTFAKFDDVHKAALQVAAELENYGKRKGNVVYRIAHSPVISLEYVSTRQSSIQFPQFPSTIFTTANALPDLSTFNVILQMYAFKETQLTFNASTTLFNARSAGSTIGNVKDYRGAIQADIPVAEIPALGRPTLSLSGAFLALLQEPLGEPLLVNGLEQSRRGNIGLFQTKITFPVKGAGISIPLSLTTANRTELVKQSTVRGTIGIAFNLDAIFAKQ